MRVLELLLSWVLRVRLKGLLSNFTSANLNLAFSKGELHLTDLSLLPEAFASLGIPLLVKTARVQRLEVLLPWRSSPPAPLVLVLHGVQLVVSSLASERHDDELQKWLHRLKRKELLEASHPAERRAAGGAAPQFDAWQLQSIVDALLRDLQVSVSDVAVRFEEGPRRPAAQLAVQTLSVRCKREKNLPRLFSICFARRAAQEAEHSCQWHIEAVAGVTWLPDGTAGLSGESPVTKALPSIDVIRRFSFSSELSMHFHWPSRTSAPDEAASSHAPQLRLEGTAELSPIQVEVTEAHLEWAVRMAQEAVHALHFVRYRSRRPGARPLANAQPDGVRAWWRYAIDSVLGDLREERRCSDVRGRAEYAKLLRAYEAALLRMVAPKMQLPRNKEARPPHDPLAAAEQTEPLSPSPPPAALPADGSGARRGGRAAGGGAAQSRPAKDFSQMELSELETLLDPASLRQSREYIRELVARERAPERSEEQARAVALEVAAAAVAATGGGGVADKFETSLMLRLSLPSLSAGLRISDRHSLAFEMGALSGDVQLSHAIRGSTQRMHLTCGAAISWVQVEHAIQQPANQPTLFSRVFAQAQGASPRSSSSRRFSASRPVTMPQLQLTGHVDFDSEGAPPRLGAALCSTAATTCCVDASLVRELACLALRLRLPTPARFSRDGTPPPPPPAAAAPPAPRGAPPSVSLQLDLNAPLLLVASAYEEPSLHMPIVRLGRLHLLLTPPAAADASPKPTHALWAHVHASVHLAPQHALSPLLFTGLASPTPRASTRFSSDSFSSPAELDLPPSEITRPPFLQLESAPHLPRPSALDSPEVAASSGGGSGGVGSPRRANSVDEPPPPPPSARTPSSGFKRIDAGRMLGDALGRFNAEAARTLELAARALSLDDPRAKGSRGAGAAHEAVLALAADVLEPAECPLFLRMQPAPPPPPPAEGAPPLPAPRLAVHGALPPLQLHASLLVLDALRQLLRFAAAAWPAAARRAPPAAAPRAAPRGLRVEIKLHAPLLALHLHARAPPAGARAPADLLLVSARAVECRMVGTADGADFALCAAEVGVRDARPLVAAARAPLLLVEGSAPRALPLGVEVSLGVGLGGAGGGGGSSGTTPLVSGFFVPIHAGVVGLQLAVSARKLLVQWNYRLAHQLVGLAVQLSQIGGDAPRQPAAPPASAPSGDSPPQPAARLRLKMEGSVEEISLCLNLDDAIHLRQGHPNQPPLTKAQVEEAVLAAKTPRPGYTPLPTEGVEVLVHVRAACREMHLQLDEFEHLQLRLSAAFYEIVSPVHAPPCASTFQMCRPWAAKCEHPGEAAVKVTIRKDPSTQDLLDVLVESEPLVYEYRNQVMLQAIDFIERCIIKAFKPLKEAAIARGEKPSPQPRWRIKVPSAVMLMPSLDEGSLEFLVEDAFVGNAVLLRPCLTEMITVQAMRVNGHAVRPAGNGEDDGVDWGGRGGGVRSPLPMIEEISAVMLTLRIPSRREDAAEAAMPFMGLEIELSTETVHVGLQPADLRLLVALWFDNLSINYFPPYDPTRVALPPLTLQMSVKLYLAQAVVWLHSSATSPANTRLQLQEIDLLVEKAIGVANPYVTGLAEIELRVKRMVAHGRWHSSEQRTSSWLQWLGAVLEPCSTTALVRGGEAPHAPVASVGAARDNPFELRVHDGNDGPLELHVGVGSQCVTLLAVPQVALLDWLLRAGGPLIEFILSRGLPPPKEQHIFVVAKQIQLCVPQPSLARVHEHERTGDKSASVPRAEGARPVPPITPMTEDTASSVLPPMLVMHFALSVEISNNPGTTGVQQASIRLSHQHTCLPVGYFDLPLPQTGSAAGSWSLLSQATHDDRGETTLSFLTLLSSLASGQPCVLERCTLYLDITQREGGQQIAVAMQDPVRISIGFPQMLLLAAAAHQWYRAIRAEPLTFPPALALLAPSTPPTLLVLVDCPYFQVTILSAEASALPLLQLLVGETSMPVSLAVEKPNATMPLAVETVVPVKAQWYHPPLFCWEPIIEPFEVALSVRAGPTMPTAINLSVASTVDINISDTMLRYAQSNLRAAFAAFEAAVLRDVAAKGEEFSGALVTTVAVNLCSIDSESQDEDLSGRDDESFPTAADASPVPSRRSVFEPESSGVPCWIANQTGAPLECWAENSSGIRGATVALDSGVTELVDLWSDTTRAVSRDWHEDTPRAITILPAGEWRPLKGVLVNLPGTVVLPLEHVESAAAGLLHPSPRSLVCEVELHERGTRLTLRSMLTLVNYTQRALAVDLDMPRAPLLHLGILNAGASMPINEAHLRGGLRLTDVGSAAAISSKLNGAADDLQHSPRKVADALDSADAAEATGRFIRPIIWLPSLMEASDNIQGPSRDDKNSWRTHFDPPPHEYLIRCCSCSIMESRATFSGELYVGSESLYFRSKDRKASRSVSIGYSKLIAITKKSGKISSAKGFVISFAPKFGGGGTEQITLLNFSWANEVRHLIERLAAQHSAEFRREGTAQAAKLRAKFELEQDADAVVLNEYPCALMHAEGSSKGKLYIMQRCLCFSGSLFGKDTRYFCYLSDVVGVELSDSPAPNSILLTSSLSEDRFTFLHHRLHAFNVITQLLALIRGDYSLASAFEPPTEPSELPAEPLLEKPRQRAPAHLVLPLALREGYLVSAACYRYDCKSQISTGCPGALVIQVPIALQNLLPIPLEWRIGPFGSKEFIEPRLALQPDQVEEFTDVVWGQRYCLQLRVPGYDWSQAVELESHQTSDRLESVKMRSLASSTESLRVLLHHRSSCARSHHLLQCYVTYWLANGTGLTLQFKRRKQLAPDSADDERLPVEISRGNLEGALGLDLQPTDAAIVDVPLSRAIGEDISGSTPVTDDAVDEQVASDNQTLLYSVPKGSKHLLAVRVVPDIASASNNTREQFNASAGWSPAFSLLPGLALGSATRSFRAGRYDLGLNIAPVETAARERTKAVTFVQRFWLSNQLKLALECEQWATPPNRLEQPRMPLASGDRAPFHWPFVKEPDHLLRIRPPPGQGTLGFVPAPDEGWSSGFPIDAAGRFVVHCEQGVKSDEPGWWSSLLRIMVQVQAIGACMEVTFSLAPPSPPPYRIINQTNYLFTCWQKGLERSATHRVEPHTAAPYAWAESSMEHSLAGSLSSLQTDASERTRAATFRLRSDASLPSSLRSWRDRQLQTLVQAQLIKLDSLSVPVQLGTPAVAWARVDLQDGVRVLTISETKTEPPSAAAAEEPHLFLGLYLAGVGISLVHTATEELLYVSGRQFTVDFVQSERTATFEAQLISFQVDNQQANATLPAVISLAADSVSSGQPAVHISAVLDMHLRKAGGAVDWYEYISCRLLELDLAIEPSFLQSMLDFVIASKVLQLAVFLRDALPKPQEHELRQRAYVKAARSELLRYGSPQRMWYFQQLELHPVKLNLTFRGSSSRTESTGPTLFWPIPNIDSAAICLTSLVRENLFGTSDELAAAIGYHYLYAVLRQVHRVVLKVEMLDVATGYSVLRSLGTGVKDLFYLPAKAVVVKPRGLGRAMAAGGASFAKHTMLAAVRPTKQVAGAVNRTTERALAAMAMSTSTSAQSNRGGWMLVQGTTGLGYGVLEGAVGLLREPYRGARKQGASGFVIGVGKGLVGAAIRPTAGIAKFTHRWAGALQQATGENEANSTHSARVGRVRPPRMLHGEQHRIAAYSIAEALARHVLQSTDEGRYLHEPLMHCDLLGEEGRSETVVIVVLTGLRLLTVDTSSWRVQLNLPLRKVTSVYLEHGSTTLVLQLVSRRRQVDHKQADTVTQGSTSNLCSSTPGAASAVPGGNVVVAGADSKRLLCHTDEAAALMLSQIQVTLSLRARKRIWHDAIRDATNPGDDSNAARTSRGSSNSNSPRSSLKTFTHRRSRSNPNPTAGQTSSEVSAQREREHMSDRSSGTTVELTAEDLLSEHSGNAISLAV